MKTPTAKSRTISFHVSNKVKKKFPPNVIRNQKYNLITFFPLVFYEQFHVFINLYFLLVSLSQLIPPLKIGYLFTYFGPLAFVLAVTMGKEAYDDWKRFKRDQENNSQKYQILTRDGIKNVPSSKLRVGDFVKIYKDQRVPADVILLRTTEASGACFIRTDQLDGETDWKLRLAVPYCQKLHSDDNLLSIDAEIYADPPIKDIHNFIGNFSRQLPGNVVPQTEPLNVENTLWMNTVLASGTAIGFVIYTGKDTRAVMNTSHPETKTGLLDIEINNLSKVIKVEEFSK
ncbi:phospholipid-translocating P-type ATPase [Gigaspora margarita]|nr:phospholipid-translocating P-type ATPase [Gigaspora margarita]